MRRPAQAPRPLQNEAFRELWQGALQVKAPALDGRLVSLKEELDDGSSDSDGSNCSGAAVRRTGGAAARHYKNPSLSDIRFFSDPRAMVKFFNTLAKANGTQHPSEIESLEIRRENLVSQKMQIAQQRSEERAAFHQLFAAKIEAITIEEEDEEEDDAASACCVG